jgi:hypothetical protein
LTVTGTVTKLTPTLMLNWSRPSSSAPLGRWRGGPFTSDEDDDSAGSAAACVVEFPLLPLSEEAGSGRGEFAGAGFVPAGKLGGGGRVAEGASGTCCCCANSAVLTIAAKARIIASTVFREDSRVKCTFAPTPLHWIMI